MAKLRKVRKQKKYRYNVNRKRLRNKRRSTGKILCKQVKEAWEEHRSVRSNLANMGLSYDPNKTIQIGTEKTIEEKSRVPSKAYVAEQLEAEAKAPRQRCFRLPKAQVRWITYLMDKYGTNYNAMARDKRNHYQETPKQIKAKINSFKKIPEQYSEYLNNKRTSIN